MSFTFIHNCNIHFVIFSSPFLPLSLPPSNPPSLPPSLSPFLPVSLSPCLPLFHCSTLPIYVFILIIFSIGKGKCYPLWCARPKQDTQPLWNTICLIYIIVISVWYLCCYCHDGYLTNHSIWIGFAWWICVTVLCIAMYLLVQVKFISESLLF